MQTTTQPTGIAVREQKNDNRIFAALLILLGVVIITAISLQSGVLRFAGRNHYIGDPRSRSRTPAIRSRLGGGLWNQ